MTTTIIYTHVVWKIYLECMVKYAQICLELSIHLKYILLSNFSLYYGCSHTNIHIISSYLLQRYSSSHPVSYIFHSCIWLSPGCVIIMIYYYYDMIMCKLYNLFTQDERNCISEVSMMKLCGCLYDYNHNTD